MFEYTEDKALDRIAEKLIARIKAAMQDGKLLPRTMNTAATADYLGISASAVRHLRDREQIPYVKINRRILYDRLQLDAWVDRRRVLKQKRGGGRR